MKKRVLTIAMLMLFVECESAWAVTKARNFTVRVRIAKSCKVAATPVNFGTLNTVLGTETANSTVTVTCNIGTPYKLSFTTAVTGLTKTTNLANGTNNIPANFSLGTAAAASGTGSGSNTITIGLTAKPYPVSGLYQATQTVYVIY